MKIFELEGFKRILSIRMKSKPLSQSYRLMGLDYGSKRVGISLSDSMTHAFPLDTYKRKLTPSYYDSTKLKVNYMKLDDESINHASNYITTIVNEHNVFGIVVGLPLMEDNSTSILCEEIISFMQKLNVESLDESMPCICTMWNERGSTVAARGHISSLSKKRRLFMENKDSLAAAIILQSFLNHFNKTDF